MTGRRRIPPGTNTIEAVRVAEVLPRQYLVHTHDALGLPKRRKSPDLAMELGDWRD
jgi:hypothetical protein